MEKKTKNIQTGISGLLFGIFAFVVIAIFAILGYFYYSTSQELKDLRDEVKRLNSEEVVEKENEDGQPTDTNVDVDTSGSTNGKCNSLSGKYYGELIEGNLYMKQTYTFNKDGSYTNFVENSEGSSGYYIVSNGSIFFMQKPSLGPSNSVSTFFYDISDDCKTITAYAGESRYTLSKVE